MRIEHLTDAEIALRPHRIRGPVAEALLDRGAITPRHAVGYASDSPAAERELTRLRDAGVIRATDDGRWWFDLRRWYAAQAHRERTRAAIAAAVTLILAVAATLFYQG